MAFRIQCMHTNHHVTDDPSFPSRVRKCFVVAFLLTRLLPWSCVMFVKSNVYPSVVYPS